jgi:hypothetical protein
MLVKLSLSKLFFIIFLIISVFSCKKVEVYSSEIVCPNGFRSIIKFARKDDVVLAIKKAAIAKKRDRSNEDYTVIRLKDKRSLKISKMSPEDSLKCMVYEAKVGEFPKPYVTKFTGQK